MSRLRVELLIVWAIVGFVLLLASLCGMPCQWPLFWAAYATMMLLLVDGPRGDGKNHEM